MKDKEIFWIDENKEFMRQKDWKRPVTHPSFFLSEKLGWMQENKLDHEVILNLSQLYCNGFDRQTTKDVIRFQNDFNGEVQSIHPEKITSGFVVQAAYIDDALLEIERCVNDLNLRLLCLPTHFMDTDGSWCSVADKKVEPIFELANRYKLALEIHPYDGPRMINLKNEYWRFHLVWMCAQTADTYHFYTLLDYPTKYPDLRVSFAHGNQFGQMNIGRRTQGFEGRPDLFEGAAHPKKSLKADNMFFDSLVHDVYSFQLLVTRNGSSQIIAALDDPYPLGEMGATPTCYPGRVIDMAVDYEVITIQERKNIWCRNVLNWLGTEREAELSKYLKFTD